MTKESRSEPPSFVELVTQWERNVNEFANQLMGTERYSQSMNQAQDIQLRLRDAFREFMTHNLTLANMPTRDDVVRVAEAVQDLGRRVSHIESVLGSMSGSAPATAPHQGPPRTKQPPSATQPATDGAAAKTGAAGGETT